MWGSSVKSFVQNFLYLFTYWPKCVQFHKILDHGSFKKKIFFFSFLLWLLSKQIDDVLKNVDDIEWPAINALRIGYHIFSVTSTVRKPQLKRCFVNKQLTYGMVLLHELPCPPTAKHYLGPLKPLPEYLQRALKTWFDSSAREVWVEWMLVSDNLGAFLPTYFYRRLTKYPNHTSLEVPVGQK